MKSRISTPTVVAAIISAQAMNASTTYLLPLWAVKERFHLLGLFTSFLQCKQSGVVCLHSNRGGDEKSYFTERFPDASLPVICDLISEISVFICAIDKEIVVPQVAAAATIMTTATRALPLKVTLVFSPTW